MIRTHKIALNPAPRHLRLLQRHADSAREAYNWALAHFRETLDAGQSCPVSMLFPFWKDARESLYPHFADLCPSAAQYAVYALGDAIAAWRDSARDNEFPKVHSPDHRPAFRADNGKRGVYCEGKRIALPGIGTVRMREPLRLEGKISAVTVAYGAGRWWACVAVDTKAPRQSRGTEVIGVDVGVRRMAVCSDGTRFEVPEALRREWRSIGRYRRQLARQLPGSNRQDRVRRKLEKASYRAKRIRDDAQYKAARAIVAAARLVVMETLDMNDMMEKGSRRLAKGVAAAAMSSMQRKIVDRCDALGVKWIKADPKFPSTRRCSRCDSIQDMSLGKDIYDCPMCLSVMDRDHNAALNLRRYGLDMN